VCIIQYLKENNTLFILKLLKTHAGHFLLSNRIDQGATHGRVLPVEIFEVQILHTHAPTCIAQIRGIKDFEMRAATKTFAGFRSK